MNVSKFTKYSHLADQALSQGTISAEDKLRILDDPDIELLPLLWAAYEVRFHYFKNNVRIHIIDNVQSGLCSEDCAYCAQSKNATHEDAAYPMKSEELILKEAEQAYKAGAFRHCMVFSGRDVGKNRIHKICEVVKKIKALYSMEICVSAGMLTPEEARLLVEAGVNRYNHNLNTSQRAYPKICTTHQYVRRVETIHRARSAGLDICSGVIIGMEESSKDILDMTSELAEVKADSVPVNFFMPIPGHRIKNPRKLTPGYCLKVLCLFRLAMPKTELRVAGGREMHLRSLQSFALYPANSLFANGYLTTGGDSVEATKKLIDDLGFDIERIDY
ncbi:MAG: biotin synthase BioB [Spirochaetales bacterium]|nr:biotin synthase BioB [Spirochaetales bacterium]